MTAAWWQVLGGVLDEPRSVAEIGAPDGPDAPGGAAHRRPARRARARRVPPNPAHRRAKLLACTEAGYWAIRRISLAQHPWAERVGGEVGAEDLRATLATMRRLLAALDED